MQQVQFGAYYLWLCWGCCLAWWRGGRPERWAATTYAVASIATLISQLLARDLYPKLIYSLIDLAVLAILLRLILAFTRRWLGAVVAIQGICVGLDLAAPSSLSTANTLSLEGWLSVAEIGCLIAGVLAYWLGGPQLQRRSGLAQPKV